MPRPSTATLGVLLVVVIWGFNLSVSKWTLGEFTPLAFTAIRFALASALLAAVLHRFEGSLRLPSGAALPLIGLGLVGNTLYQLGFILGLARTTATNSGLVLASMPVTVAAISAATGLEQLSRRAVQGLALASVGVVLVIASHGVDLSGGTLVGDLLTLAAVLCWALFTLGVRQFRTGLSPLAITTWTVIFGTPLLVAAGIPELARMDWTATSAAGWGGLLYSSVLSLVVAYILWNRSVRVVGSNRTAIYATLTPLVAMLTAMLILGERPRPVQLAGGALVIGGVLLSQSAARRPAPPTPSP